MRFREYTSADLAFVLSGWSSSLRKTRDIPFIQNRNWARVMRPVLWETIAAATVLVAEGEVLYGFIAFDPRPPRRPKRRSRRPTPPFVDYVLYVYVAQPFRRTGVARGLFQAAGIDPAGQFAYAARTRASWECRSKFKNAVYDPFRCRFPQEETDVEREAER